MRTAVGASDQQWRDLGQNKMGDNEQQQSNRMVMLSGAADGVSLTHQRPCTVILNHRGYTMMVNTLFASNRAESSCNYHEDTRNVL